MGCDCLFQHFGLFCASNSIRLWSLNVKGREKGMKKCFSALSWQKAVIIHTLPERSVRTIGEQWRAGLSRGVLVSAVACRSQTKCRFSVTDFIIVTTDDKK